MAAFETGGGSREGEIELHRCERMSYGLLEACTLDMSLTQRGEPNMPAASGRLLRCASITIEAASPAPSFHP